MRRSPRLAYLTTRYPALSHTFIEREVQALRRLGAEVQTISLRSASGEHLISPAKRAAARTTYAVRPPHWGDVLRAHANALLFHPRAYAATLAEALSLARCGPRGALWQLFYFAEALVVWSRCREGGAEHIHAHHGSAPADVALLVAALGRRAGEGPRSWSLTVHGPAELSDMRLFGLAAKAARADAVVCISEFARSQVMALLDERDWHKLRVVHCGVDPAAYAAAVLRPRPVVALAERRAQRGGLAARRQGRAQLLCVGRLVAEKGHAVLLEALAVLAREGRDVEALIVGSGPQRDALERQAARLGIEERVIFCGALAPEEVAARYAQARVFCSPSFAEGVPVVLMEAMASGCPVIATAIAGVRELVRDGDTGLLVTPGSSRELAVAIGLLLDSPELCEELARAARAHVCREFDVDRSALALLDVFGAIHPPQPQEDGAEPEPAAAGRAAALAGG
jgi:colanic acid/amylovoran biosynthesis glycosyltransferase